MRGGSAAHGCGGSDSVMVAARGARRWRRMASKGGSPRARRRAQRRTGDRARKIRHNRGQRASRPATSRARRGRRGCCPQQARADLRFQAAADPRTERRSGSRPTASASRCKRCTASWSASGARRTGERCGKCPVATERNASKLRSGRLTAQSEPHFGAALSHGSVSGPNVAHDERGVEQQQLRVVPRQGKRDQPDHAADDDHRDAGLTHLLSRVR